MSEYEVIKWIVMWLMMVCYEVKWGWQDWWSKDNIIIGRVATFHLNEYMNRVRFEEISTGINYTDEETPYYVDRLFQVRRLVEAWSANMSTNFN